MDDNITLESLMGTDENLSPSGVQREMPELSEAERQSITKWQHRIIAAKGYFRDDFKRMREDMLIARQGAEDYWIKSGNYTVPIINRYINQSVSALYAKNPTATAEKRKTLDYTLWDGKPDTAIAALEGAMLGDPQATQIAQDIEQGRQKQELMGKIGETLEICFDYYSNEQKPRLKPLMKSFVRRAKTCGVGYMMLGFQREFGELSPDETAKLEDSRNKLGEIQRRAQDQQDGEMTPDQQYEAYELETMIADIQSQEDVLLREGPKFMFPKATNVIVDPECTELMGFVGAGWIAREFHKTPDDIQKLYNVDIKNDYTSYHEHGGGEMADYHRRANTSGDNPRDEKQGMVCVWEVYNKDLEQTFTIADGYKGYLVKPRQPEYWMEGFWPIFALTFNASESEEDLYPISDTHQLKHVQAEYNRSREYRRMHREANKPKYMAVKGRLTETDKSLVESAPAHAVVEMESLGSGERVDDLLQPFRSVPIDPALYETNSEMEDTLRIVGAQEANIGGTSGATATESSIAEGGRQTSLASNVDDLDEFLSDVFGAFGQLLLMELSAETVAEIVGPGAVWPELSKKEIAKQIILKIRAGSSGSPNKASELANMERGMPYLLQLPGVNPYPLGQRYADLLDINLDEVIVDGMPSITALNAQAGNAQEPVSDDPNAQGGQGGDNQEQPAQNEPGPQAGFTQPIDNLG